MSCFGPGQALLWFNLICKKASVMSHIRFSLCSTHYARRSQELIYQLINTLMLLNVIRAWQYTQWLCLLSSCSANGGPKSDVCTQLCSYITSEAQSSKLPLERPPTNFGQGLQCASRSGILSRRICSLTLSIYL